MPGLPLTGVVLSTALILVAVLVVVRHWRRSSGQSPAPASARGTAAGSAGKPMAPREIAIVPGFSDTAPPDLGARVPAQPGPAAHPQARPAAHPQARPTAGPQSDRHGPGPPLNGQRAIAPAVTANEQIASYYEQADKLMADYLTALGWTHQPPPSLQPPGPAEHTKRHPPPNGGHKQ